MSYLLNSPLVLEGLCGRVSSSLLWIWNKIQNKMYKYNPKKQLENREKVDSFFRNDNSVGENDTSVWLGEKLFTPWSGQRNACRKMTDDNTHTARTSSMSKESVFLVRSCDSWSGARPQGALSGVEVRFASSSTSALLTAWLSSLSLRTPDWRSPDSASCSPLAVAGGPVFLGSGLSGGQDIGKFKYLCISMGAFYRLCSSFSVM